MIGTIPSVFTPGIFIYKLNLQLNNFEVSAKNKILLC